MSVGTQSTLNFTNGFAVTNSGGKINVDGSGFLHTTGNESASGNKTFSGNTTFSGTVTNSNATTTGTNTSISTGNGLTSGQALSVGTGSSTFSTGSGSGFFYGGATGSYTGAVAISNTGAFTGTLVALTADSTTSGTVLGISAQSLTTGKAIDVMLGTLYSGTSDAQGSVGAVNVRAQNFTGNVFNVSSTGAAGASANLANFSSAQLAGNVVKVSGTSLTTGTAVSVLLGTAGTGEVINTAAGYTGTLLSLQVNGSPVFSVNQAGNTTVAGTLGVTGATTLGSTLAVTGNVTVNTNKLTIAAATGNITGPSTGAWTIDNGNASAINIGTATATTINIGRTGQSTVVGGNLTSTETFIVGPGAPNKLTVSSTTGNLTSQGSGQFGSTSANAANLAGAANGSPVVLSAVGASDANVGISLQPKGSGRVTISSASQGLDVGGNVVVGSANKIELVGAATGSAPALQINSTSTDANVNLALTARGTGRVLITTGGLTIQSGTLLGPSAGTFSIDNSNASAINIGGTTATTLNLGRTGQTQALLGNVTIGGTLTGPANFVIDSTSGTLSIGGTNATTLNLGRTGQTQALLGNGTVAGTLGVTGATTLSSTLTVTGNTQLNGTLTVGATGNAITEIKRGTCSITTVNVVKNTTVNTNCAPGVDLATNNYTVFISPQTTIGTNLAYSIADVTTTNIVIAWQADNTNTATGNLTFNWVAMR